KHATPSLKITKDGKLDWFFNQWVRGTEIPRYTAKVDVTDAPGGKYKLTGSITQSEVSPNFAAVVPVYLMFDKNSVARLGQVLLVGNASKPVDVELALPKKPKSVVVNAMHDVLSR